LEYGGPDGIRARWYTSIRAQIPVVGAKNSRNRREGSIMKTRYALLPALLMAAMTVPLLGGQNHEDTTKADITTLAMTADTHHIVLDLTDAIAGKTVSGATARVMVVFPSARSSSLDLKPMMSHLGGALALDEKGEYRFTVAVNVGGVSKTTQFHYAVK
jgi:hypothetical protein